MSASKYRAWLEEANDDRKSAEYLFKGRRYSKACFHSQQAAEKAVKALLIKRCRRYEDVHSVAGLLQLTQKHVEVPEKLMAKANRLDKHYVPTRYPNAWPAGAPHEHYMEEDAEEAIQDAKSVLEFVEEKIK